MQRRSTKSRSADSATRAKMNASLALLACCVVGSAVAYNVQRESPYNVGPNDPYPVAGNTYLQPELSQRLFWGNQGSNQVGGTGWWATLTNKFPFLGNMFGRMELQNQYGAPNQYVSSHYGVPSQIGLSTQYGPPSYQQPQYNQVPQFYQQPPQQFNQRFAPFGRDVGFTDDAVIVTPPFVPIAPQPAPVPAPAPAPAPVAPSGYRYDKPQFRLELPHK